MFPWKKKTPEVIDTKWALKLLEKVVKQKGADYVYPEDHKSRVVPVGGDAMCMYVHNDKPSCIAGQVFVKAGASVDDLVSIEGYGADNVAGILGGFTAEAGWTLRQAQMVQDRGDTWGAALTAAKNYATAKGWV